MGKFVQMSNDALPATTKLAIDNNGVASLASTGLEGPPLPEQQAYADVLGGAIDASGVVEMDLVENSTSVFVGSYATGELDMADISKNPTEGPGSQASMAAHEIAEQTDKQLNGASYSNAHEKGKAAETAVNGRWVRTNESLRGAFLNPWGTIAEFRFKRGSATKDVTMKASRNNVYDVEVQ